MRILCCILLISGSTGSFAQTKKIAHRSHSGSNSTFSLKDIDNLGVAPTQRITEANLDTLKILPDNRIVMITSQTCHDENWNGRVLSDTSIWKAGSDTLDNHPLFSKKHELNHIKKELKQTYNFQNDIDEVEFIGYDNQKPKSKKKRKSGGSASASAKASASAEANGDMQTGDTQKKGKNPKEHNEPQAMQTNKTIDHEDAPIDHSMLWFLMAIPFISLGWWSRWFKD